MKIEVFGHQQDLLDGQLDKEESIHREEDVSSEILNTPQRTSIIG